MTDAPIFDQALTDHGLEVPAAVYGGAPFTLEKSTYTCETCNTRPAEGAARHCQACIDDAAQDLYSARQTAGWEAGLDVRDSWPIVNFGRPL